MFLTGGPMGTAHHSDFYLVVFISSRSPSTSQASCKSSPTLQREPFGPDERLPHIPSPVWAAAEDERCAGIEEIIAQFLPGSADEGQAPLSFPVAKARSANRAAKRAAPSGVAALQGFAGRCFAKVGISCAAEARTLLVARAGVSRSPPPSGHTAQPLSLAEVLAKLASVLDKPRGARSLEE